MGDRTVGSITGRAPPAAPEESSPLAYSLSIWQRQKAISGMHAARSKLVGVESDT